MERANFQLFTKSGLLSSETELRVKELTKVVSLYQHQVLIDVRRLERERERKRDGRENEKIMKLIDLATEEKASQTRHINQRKAISSDGLKCSNAHAKVNELKRRHRREVKAGRRPERILSVLIILLLGRVV